MLRAERIRTNVVVFDQVKVIRCTGKNVIRLTGSKPVGGSGDLLHNFHDQICVKSGLAKDVGNEAAAVHSHCTIIVGGIPIW